MAKRKRKWKGTPAQRAALKKGQAALAKWRAKHGKNPRGKVREIQSARGDIYRIENHPNGGYVVRLWNAHYRAWIESFQPRFATIKAARDAIKERIASNPRGKGKRTKKFKRCVRKVRARGGVRSPKDVCAATIFHKKKRKSNPKDFTIVASGLASAGPRATGKPAMGFWTGRNSVTDNPRDAVHYPRRAAAQKTMLALRQAYPSVNWSVIP